MGAPGGRKVSGRKTSGRRRVCRHTASASVLGRALSSAALLAVSLLAVLSPVPAASAATVPAPALTVSLTSITPTVAVPKAPVTITGSVRNSGEVAVPSPVARALIGRPLTSRKAVSDWATPAEDEPTAGQTPTQRSLAEVARTPLGKAIAPGAVAGFTLIVPADAVTQADSFAVLPLSVEVVGIQSAGAQQTGDVHTFLPALATVKRYEPLSIAWLVPLTLDPDPALHGMASPARTAAWSRAIGPGSRLDRLIQGTENANITWAIDPAILGPPASVPEVDAAATPSPTPSSSQSPQTSQPPAGTTAPDPVTGATAALAQRLKAAAARHTLWSLPYADPDLAGLLPLTSGDQLTALIHHPSTVNIAVGPARADIAWPVSGTLTAQSQARLRRGFGAPGLTAAVTSSKATGGGDGFTANASNRSGSGLPLLAYDEELSRTVAQTSSKATGALTVQRFLADSMALLGERPGTRDRSVLIAEPRTFAGDPAVLRSLFAAVAKAPWLTPTTTGQLLAASQALPPKPASQGAGETAAPTPTPSPALPTAQPTAPDPLSPGDSPLTSETLASIPGTRSDITGIASILGNGEPFTVAWTDAQTQRLSTRWREHPRGITTIDAATRLAISAVSRSVRVVPSSVNFFADRGVLQVIVVNDLDVPIHDVRLTLTPAQPRLRIESQPGPLRIGAKSRVNVPLQVTSIAAGLVGVEAVLTTPNGTPLGQNASVDVRVQPPATWIYWVLGGLAGLVLVLGTQRSLRRGSTRASRPDAQELSFND